MISQAALGLWVESSASMGLMAAQGAGRSVAWGGDLADLDNDGHLDAVFTYGGVFGEAYPKAQPNELFHNRGDGSFEPVGDLWGWNEQNVGRGAIAVDVNNDGWLDLVDRELGGVVTVSTAACDARAWLKIRLHDEARPNSRAVGAKVVVVAGEERQVRWVTAGSRSYCSGGPPEVHFGLGALEAIDRIEVLWPTGEERVYEGVATRQVLDLWPDDG